MRRGRRAARFARRWGSGFGASIGIAVGPRVARAMEPDWPWLPVVMVAAVAAAAIGVLWLATWRAARP